MKKPRPSLERTGVRRASAPFQITACTGTGRRPSAPLARLRTSFDSVPRRHPPTRTKKARQRRNSRPGRFLAPCLTWRQYASNHHESNCKVQARMESRACQGRRAWPCLIRAPAAGRGRRGHTSARQTDTVHGQAARRRARDRLACPGPRAHAKTNDAAGGTGGAVGVCLAILTRRRDRHTPKLRTAYCNAIVG